MDEFEVVRHAAVEAFLADAAAFLGEREAEHNLILAIAATLRDHPDAFSGRPYLAVVRRGANIACAALRTPPYNLVLSLAEPLAAVDSVARDLAADGELPGVNGPTEPARRFAATWAETTGCRAVVDVRERLFRLRRVIQPPRVPGVWRVAEDRDAAILRDWLPAFRLEAIPNEPPPPDIDATVARWIAQVARRMYLWEVDGEVVSMVGANLPDGGASRIGPVYTPPERRGHGYASALTAAASQHQFDSGRTVCYLFTDLANPTSNHIYRAIGYEPVCDFDAWRFAK